MQGFSVASTARLAAFARLLALLFTLLQLGSVLYRVGPAGLGGSNLAVIGMVLVLSLAWTGFYWIYAAEAAAEEHTPAVSHTAVSAAPSEREPYQPEESQVTEASFEASSEGENPPESLAAEERVTQSIPADEESNLPADVREADRQPHGYAHSPSGEEDSLIPPEATEMPDEEDSPSFLPLHSAALWMLALATIPTAFQQFVAISNTLEIPPIGWVIYISGGLETLLWAAFFLVLAGKLPGPWLGKLASWLLVLGMIGSYGSVNRLIALGQLFLDGTIAFEWTRNSFDTFLSVSGSVVAPLTALTGLLFLWAVWRQESGTPKTKVLGV